MNEPKFLGVQAGHVFTFDGVEYVVHNRCSNPRVGSFWICARHGLRLRGVDDLAIHLAKPGDHAALWHCPDHGPEIP